MSEFSKIFLRECLGNEAGPQKLFGIFGKHPGWNDHIEDLPLPTMSMATAKQLLYVQGIGSQISSGAWARLAESACLPDFDHALLWVRGRQFLAGRMWASRDGKRRAHFPMVAFFQGTNLPPETALGPIFAELDRVAAGCRAARSADEVRELVAAVADAGDAAPDESTPASPCTLGVPRSTVAKLARSLGGRLPPHCRLPADPDDLLRSLRFWSRICTSFAPADTPLLFLLPNGAPWVDVLACEPASAQFFCLRAGLPVLPMTYVPEPQEAVAEVDADECVKAGPGGTASPGGRGWFSRMLGGQ